MTPTEWLHAVIDQLNVKFPPPAGRSHGFYRDDERRLTIMIQLPTCEGQQPQFERLHLDDGDDVKYTPVELVELIAQLMFG